MTDFFFHTRLLVGLSVTTCIQFASLIVQSILLKQKSLSVHQYPKPLPLVRIMKFAHHSRIASTTIKLISKPILLSILKIILKTFQPIGAGTPNIAQINMQSAGCWCCHLADQFVLYYFLYLSV